MKKLKFREKLGLIMGVSIIIIGSFFEAIENKLGVIPDWMIIIGLAFVACFLVYINYDGKKKRKEEEEV
ncbi:MAG: hypothetical protein R6U02_06975 [Alkalibacterium sp.]|uniref:hypothetical protein n=1 Tax=Alkalibacterium sp. TaxID=1872447 RepID=UPI00397098D5